MLILDKEQAYFNSNNKLLKRTLPVTVPVITDKIGWLTRFLRLYLHKSAYESCTKRNKTVKKVKAKEKELIAVGQ